jgi:Putative beta-barrel porin-2, OmpL-like. bbp2
MTMYFREVHARARAIVAATFLLAIVVAPAAAQQLQGTGFTIAASIAGDVASVAPQDPPPAPPPQDPAQTPPQTPPAPTPEEIAKKQDDTTMDFFRRIEFSGFADTYYTYNFNKPQKPCTTIGGVAVFNCLYNFNVAHNSFSLNMAEVSLAKTPTADSRAGFRVDLDYGPTQALVTGGEPGGQSIYQNIGQAYVSFLAPVGSGLAIDVGKFVTWNGNEVIKTKDNWNYSRGLLFAWAIPYYHEGLRVAYNATDKVTLTGYVVNGWNNSVDNNEGKTVGATITIKPSAALALTENYTGGPEQNNDDTDWRQLSDTIVTYTVNKMVSVAGNYDYGQDKVNGSKVDWQGIAGFLKVQANDWFALAPRVEYFDDKDGFQTGTAQKLWEATVTAEFKHKDGVVMRLEYRHDMSNVPYFNSDASIASKKNQDTFTVGVIYAFTTKAQ